MRDDEFWSHLCCSKQPTCSSDDAGIHLVPPHWIFPSTAAVFLGFPLINYLVFVSPLFILSPRKLCTSIRRKTSGWTMEPPGFPHVGVPCGCESDRCAHPTAVARQKVTLKQPRPLRVWLFFFFIKKRKYMSWEKEDSQSMQKARNFTDGEK